MQENNELQTYSPEEVEQLIVMTEELQTENEHQREELRKLHRQQQTSLSDNQRLSAELRTALAKLSEKQQQIQTLLSENQKLKLQVQQLTVKNESLQSSDEQLKRAKELKKRSEQQEKQAKEIERQASISADRAKKEANAAIAAANKREAAAKNAQSTAELTKKKESELIQAEAEKLNENFRLKWIGIFTIVMSYGIFTTFFTMGKSERCMNDIIAAGRAIESFFVGAYKVISTLVSGAASIGEKISQPLLAMIVGDLLVILTVAVCIGVPVVGLYFGSKALIGCYKEHCMDWITPFVFLGCFAVLVWFAELMPLNIVLLLILSHAVYILVRWYIEK